MNGRAKHSANRRPKHSAGKENDNSVILVLLIAAVVLLGVPALAFAGMLLFRSDKNVTASSPKPVPGSTGEAGGGSGGGKGSSTTPTTTGPSTQPPGSAVDMTGASEDPKVAEFPTSPAAHLLAVRVGQHDGFERVVFEFDGAVPGYRVEYVERLTEDPSDRPVQLPGTPLRVIISPASGVDLGAGTYTQVYKGPNEIAGTGGVVRQLKSAGDFEGVLTWGIGLDQRRPFKVSTLPNPTRVIVDIAAS